VTTVWFPSYYCISLLNLPSLLFFTAVWHLWHHSETFTESYALDDGSPGIRRYAIGPIKSFKAVELRTKTNKRLYYSMKSMCTKFDEAAGVQEGSTPSISRLNELYARVLPILPTNVTAKGRVRNVNQLTWVRVINVMNSEET
jgi:hypothetical protein